MSTASVQSVDVSSAALCQLVAHGVTASARVQQTGPQQRDTLTSAQIGRLHSRQRTLESEAAIGVVEGAGSTVARFLRIRVIYPTARRRRACADLSASLR